MQTAAKSEMEKSGSVARNLVETSEHSRNGNRGIQSLVGVGIIMVENLFDWHNVFHKSHMVVAGIESGNKQLSSVSKLSAPLYRLVYRRAGN